MSAHPQPSPDPRADQQRKIAAVLERKSRGAQARRFDRAGQLPAVVRLTHRTGNRGR